MSLFDRLKFKFINSEKALQNYDVGGIHNSQSMQDLFVLSMLNGKSNGVYVEIGASEPKFINNSWLLESIYKWKGISFEICEKKVGHFNSERFNKCICADAIKFDYKTFFDENKYPKQIDYLQLDVDPSHQSLETLKKLPLNDYRFSAITFEHDLYAGGIEVQKNQYDILSKLGYVRVCKNVKNQSNPFEDWWIDPLIIPEDRWSLFSGKNDIEFTEIILN